MSHVKARGTAQNPPRPPFRPRNAFLAGAAMLLASLLITSCGSESEPTGDNVDDVNGTSAGATASKQAGGDPIYGGGDTTDTHKPVANYVDNRTGVQIFGSSTFGAYTKGSSDHAPFGVRLNVTCYVLNNTGEYASVNALYHIKGGKWDDGWVPANVMLNDPKAKVGDVTTPALDPRVKECSS